MAKRFHRSLCRVLSLALAVSCFGAQWAPRAFAAEDEHRLVFASDFHGVEGAIETAFSGLPEGVEYAGLLGDMVGDRGDMHPEYQSSWILGQVQAVLPALDNEHVAIVWGSHDVQVVDDAGIVKCLGGHDSGQIYRGIDADGDAAYYLYSVGYFDMRDGGEVSAAAAASFKSWVRSIEPGAPVLVLCHVPMQALRADNNGASYWNEALNFAATGVEGITSASAEAEVVRNVVFLCAHNHSVSETEYYFAAGGTMDVQVDTTIEEEESSEADEKSAGESKTTDETAPLTAAGGSAEEGGAQLVEQGQGGDAIDQEATGETMQQAGDPGEAATALEVQAEADGDGTSGGEEPKPRPRRREPKGSASRIYYTSLVAGYLKTSGNATLVTIADGAVLLTKYHAGEIVDLGVDGVSGEQVASPVVLPRIERTEPRGWYRGTDGRWRYGAQLVDGVGDLKSDWTRWNGKWYYLKADGAMARAQWIKDAGKWYYLGGDGAMLRYRGLFWGGSWYWLKEQGDMAQDETINIGFGNYEYNRWGQWTAYEAAKLT